MAGSSIKHWRYKSHEKDLVVKTVENGSNSSNVVGNVLFFSWGNEN